MWITCVYGCAVIISFFPIPWTAEGGLTLSTVARHFRGATEGRSQHGILITIGHFTADARAEASRPGARLVDLVDGYLLAEKLKELGLGVDVASQETVRLRPEFFASI